MKEGKTDEALATVALVANVLAKASVLLHPFMPKTTNIVADTLGFVINTESYYALLKEKRLLATFTIKQTGPLFPRVDEPLMPEAPKAMMEGEKPKESKKEAIKESKKVEPAAEESAGLITFDEFFNTTLKVGTIVEAEEVPKSKKLLKLQVDLGESELRQIVAGIKDYYSPEALYSVIEVLLSANKFDGALLSSGLDDSPEVLEKINERCRLR